MYCRGKSAESVASACRQLAGSSNRVVATRCDLAMSEAVTTLLASDQLRIVYDRDASALVVAAAAVVEPDNSGVVGVVTAGTSDWPVAAEASLIAREAGCTVHVYRDVGVAATSPGQAAGVFSLIAAPM